MKQFIDEFHFDFAVLLTVLTLFTGVVWALDKWLLGPRRRAAQGPVEGAMDDDKPGAIVDFSRSFFPVILIVLLLRSFVAEPFRIPSGSMIPTLLIGDFILVDKFSYGLRMPVGYWKAVDLGEPKRGDVVVFRYPLDQSKDFIKRLVGLPGDRIEYRNKTLYINGEQQALEPDGVYPTPGHRAGGVVEKYTENLGGVRHAILINPSDPARDGYWIVPEGHYFMMGDNRDGSDDSRRWGFVPEHNLVGHAFLIWMSWDGVKNRPAFDRIGDAVN